MLENILEKLEKSITDLAKRNVELQAHNELLNQQLQQAREENDRLQLATLEQEERMGSAITRLQGLLQKANNSVDNVL